MALPGMVDHVPGGHLFVAGGLPDVLHPQMNRRESRNEPSTRLWPRQPQEEAGWSYSQTVLVRKAPSLTLPARKNPGEMGWFYERRTDPSQ